MFKLVLCDYVVNRLIKETTTHNALNWVCSAHAFIYTLVNQRISLFFFGNYERLYRISSVIRQSFFLLKNPKDLDPSYKMDLDLWDRLGRVKLVL